jgi:hypothetical protein
MGHAYYICGGCGRRLSFGRPLYEHRCKPDAAPAVPPPHDTRTQP